MTYLIIFSGIFLIGGFLELISSKIILDKKKLNERRAHIENMLIEFIISIILGLISLVIYLLK